VADDVLEFHAARLLLLVRYCGVRKANTGLYTIEGLTKMAKLDFFVRYPAFFGSAVVAGGAQVGAGATESPMIRYQYGPWDSRYYQVLGYLSARRLVEIEKEGARVTVRLTGCGRGHAEQLAAQGPYLGLVSHMRDVGGALRTRTGNALKNLIYRQFDAEVGQLDWGDTI
jgi:hypothetical protein